MTQSMSKIHLIKGDIREEEDCKKACKNQDYIFHLAACVSVPQSIEEPAFCHKSNINGTFHLLEQARLNRVQRFMLSSSCAVYGQQTAPVNEHTACNPTSPYAYSKWMAELLCQQYANTYNVPTLSLRYFNVTGERQNPYGPYAGVYAKFSDLIKKNEPVTIFGDGTQTRDFISVHQVVEANLLLAQLPAHKLKGQPINIGTGKATTVLDILNRIKQSYPHYTLKPIFAPERKGDILYSCADATLLNKLKKEITIEKDFWYTNVSNPSIVKGI